MAKRMIEVPVMKLAGEIDQLRDDTRFDEFEDHCCVGEIAVDDALTASERALERVHTGRSMIVSCNRQCRQSRGHARR